MRKVKTFLHLCGINICALSGNNYCMKLLNKAENLLWRHEKINKRAEKKNDAIVKM